MKIIRQITPPIVLTAFRTARRAVRAIIGARPSFQPAFDPHAMKLFDASIRASSRYLEYGCGGSTMYALRHSNASVVSVDTAEPWIAKVLAAGGENCSRLHIEHVDIGPIGDWGIPKTYSSRAAFRTYVELPWRSMPNPDLVLVDGRFRVACFLQAMLLARPGTRILFDDYVRPDYHVVEEVVHPQLVAGRMGLFTTPESFDRVSARTLLDTFLIVWK
jgi:hypothetical protein